jgi:hypothetical protein
VGTLLDICAKAGYFVGHIKVRAMTLTNRSASVFACIGPFRMEPASSQRVYVACVSLPKEDAIHP